MWCAAKVKSYKDNDLSPPFWYLPRNRSILRRLTSRRKCSLLSTETRETQTFPPRLG